MYHDTIDRKLTIFISSKIDKRYNIVRKALKTLLLETSLVAYVYAFETEGASSSDVKSAYLREVSLSDLCIFLIDNADGVSDAVYAEHERAVNAGIHRLYFFCDERKKKPTPLQKELMHSGKVKYYDKVHEFSDFPNIAYRSVLQDIIDLYRGNNIENQDTNQTTQHPSIMAASMNMFTLKKDVYKKYDIESNLVRVFSPYSVNQSGEICESSYDSLCTIFLLCVLGRSAFDKN